MSAPRVRRILETALYVEDLGRAKAFYEDVLGLGVMLDSERLVALDAGEGTVLLLFRRGASRDAIATDGGSIPPHDGEGPVHLALAIEEPEVEAWRDRLGAADVEVESEQEWPRGGRSLYFRDPDGHLVELASPGVWPIY